MGLLQQSQFWVGMPQGLVKSEAHLHWLQVAKDGSDRMEKVFLLLPLYSYFTYFLHINDGVTCLAILTCNPAGKDFSPRPHEGEIAAIAEAE